MSSYQPLCQAFTTRSYLKLHNERLLQKPGPVRGEPTKQYPVLLPEELGEWAKHQPEGLSALVRRLLREAKQKAERQK